MTLTLTMALKMTKGHLPQPSQPVLQNLEEAGNIVDLQKLGHSLLHPCETVFTITLTFQFSVLFFVLNILVAWVVVVVFFGGYSSK